MTASRPTQMDVTPQADDGLRRCLVAGADRPREELLRFVVGPDGVLCPDLAEKLPGRGLWIGATRETFNTALKKKLFARAAKAPVITPPDLPDLVEHLLRRQVVELLGLCRGAGLVISGFAQVEPAVQSGAVTLLLVATDAGEDGLSKLTRALPAWRLLDSQTQGQALGLTQNVYAALRPHRLTARLATAFARLGGFSAPENQEKVAPNAAMAQIGPVISR